MGNSTEERTAYIYIYNIIFFPNKLIKHRIEQ